MACAADSIWVVHSAECTGEHGNPAAVSMSSLLRRFVPEQSHNINDLSIFSPSSPYSKFAQIQTFLWRCLFDIFGAMNSIFISARIEMISENDKSRVT
jgi:hypothetical protein